MMATSLDEVEPMTYKQALSLPNANKWKAAMQEELESMWTNQVWDLVDLPAGCKAIGNKWVLKIKHNSDGSIERYKARLIAKGYTQREGIDYDETFLPSGQVRFTSRDTRDHRQVRSRIGPNGRYDCISHWRTRRGDYHGSTRGVQI